MSSPVSSIKRKLESRLDNPERCHTLDDLLERLEAAEQRRQVRLRFRPHQCEPRSDRRSSAMVGPAAA
jgi:hypothetical protein